MVSKTITYEDFNGVERTETFYFNMTKAELAQWMTGGDGGMMERIQAIMDAKDEAKMREMFCELIDRSYGVKSADGRRFEKNEALLADFKATQAYSDLYMELMTDTEKSVEFVNGIMPSDLRKAAQNGNAPVMMPVT